MDDSSSGGIRLLLGLIAGALIGVSMGLGVDIVGTETAIMAAAVSVIVGFASTYLLKMGVPRRDKPSAMGIVALLVMLACYLVIGRLVLATDNTAGRRLLALRLRYWWVGRWHFGVSCSNRLRCFFLPPF